MGQLTREDVRSLLKEELSIGLEDYMCKQLPRALKEQARQIVHMLQDGVSSDSCASAGGGGLGKVASYITQSEAAELHKDTCYLSPSYMTEPSREPDGEKCITGERSNPEERSKNLTDPAVSSAVESVVESHGGFMGSRVAERRRQRTRYEIVADHHPSLRSPLLLWENLYSLFGVYDAPARTDPLSRFVDSNTFHTLVTLLIFSHCVFMMVTADHEIKNPSEETPLYMRMGSRAFIVMYTVEFALKLHRQRLYYFYDKHWKYNWLDFSLLALSYFLELSESLVNVGWLRMLRVLRLARSLRVLELVTMFKPLRVILQSLASTSGTLAWSVICLGSVNCLFALVLVMQVAAYLREVHAEDRPVDQDQQELLLHYFGSVYRTTLSLLGTSTGASIGWDALYQILNPTGFANQIFLLLYVAVSQIAILNIILGLFVENAMRSMTVSKEEAALRHAETEHEIESNIRALCVEADVLQNGKLSQREWARALGEGKLQIYFESVGLRVQNLLDYFHHMSLSSEEGQVDIERFVKGCMRMKGQATVFDVQMLLRLVQGIQESVSEAKSRPASPCCASPKGCLARAPRESI